MIKNNYTGTIAKNIAVIETVMESAGITNEYAKIGILACIGKESGFKPLNENLSYSKERLPEVWGAFSKTGKTVPKGQGKNNYNDLAVQMEHNPQALGDFVYAKLGGYKYRGRGFNQITFLYHYKEYAALTGLDLVNNPDLLNDVAVAAKCAVAFLVKGVKLLTIDPNGFLNQKDATYAFVRANAGGGEVKGTQGYANALLCEKHFTIV